MSAASTATKPRAVPAAARTGGGAGAVLAWAALAVGGHVAYVLMLHPGAWHYGFREPANLLAERPVALAYVVVQSLAVAWGGRTLAADLAHRLGLARLAGLALVTTFASALLARSPTAYLGQLVLTAWVHAANLGNLALLVRALPPAAATWAAGYFDPAGRVPPGPGQSAVTWLAAAFAFVGSAALAVLVFERIPHVPDSMAYAFQARTYAAGLAYLPSPAVREPFDRFLLMDEGGKWFSVFPPGWPLVLALGMKAGIPWLINPALGAIGVLLAHALAAALVSRGTANLVAVLLALSPTYLYMAASGMAHPFSLVCALTALLAVHKARVGNSLWGGAAGLAVGALFLTRPVEGVVVGLAGGLWAVVPWARRLPSTALALGFVGVLPGVGLFLANNWLLTGHPLRDPIQHYFDRTFYPGCNTLGFGPDKGNFGWGNDVFPGHSPLEAAIHANINLNLLDIELFGWACGSLLLLVVAAVWGRRLAPVQPFATLAALTVLSTIFYWYSGADLGPRYWFQCLVPFAVFTTVGAAAAAARLHISVGRTALFVLLASTLGTLSVVPWRAVNKYRDYRGVSPAVGRLAAEYRFGRSLVLVRGNRHTDYACAAIYNPVDLAADAPVYAWESGPDAAARLRAAFPDRPIWVIAGPTVTGRGFEVLAGPSLRHAIESSHAND